MGAFDRIKSAIGMEEPSVDNFECQACGATYELKHHRCEKCGSDRVVDVAATGD